MEILIVLCAVGFVLFSRKNLLRGSNSSKYGTDIFLIIVFVVFLLALGHY